MTERIAVVGSRAHPNVEIVREYVRSLPAGTVVISGGARGVDGAAEAEAALCGLAVVRHLPNFFPKGIPITRPFVSIGDRDAYLYRNTLIALDCDRMIVFPDGSKGGCWDAAREAVRFRRPVEVRWASGKVEAFRGKR